eukprot:TRINITY_DN586_c0_g1_i1.p3 TRINITY_DN586_c0_g1~~TRINITY_DN586_c0_g1_i1.p3  ORF type:complete len:171 (+),score=26.88 TRINITY_DN586_c0_g1_i1:123-635(+)
MLFRLQHQFGNTARVQRLTAKQLQRVGDSFAALNMLAKLRREDPTDTETWKTIVNIHELRGEIDEAIAELEHYLLVFQDDVQVWVWLASLYETHKKDFFRAAFCVEEAISKSPTDADLHVWYSKLLCHVGGAERLQAYQHAVFALVLTGGRHESARDAVAKSRLERTSLH